MARSVDQEAMSAPDDPMPGGAWYFGVPYRNDCDGRISLAIKPRPDDPAKLMLLTRVMRRQLRVRCAACQPRGEVGRLDLPDGTSFTLSVLPPTRRS
jgi:hypothetical protein